MFLLRHMGCSLAREPVAVANRIRISVSERPFFVMVDPWFLNESTVAIRSPLIVISLSGCGSLVPMLSILLLSTFISIPYEVDALSKQSVRSANSGRVLSIKSISLVNQRLLNSLPPMETVPLNSSRAVVIMCSRCKLNRHLERGHPCRTLMLVLNGSLTTPPTSTENDDCLYRALIKSMISLS